MPQEPESLQRILQKHRSTRNNLASDSSSARGIAAWYWPVPRSASKPVTEIYSPRTPIASGGYTRVISGVARTPINWDNPIPRDRVLILENVHLRFLPQDLHHRARLFQVVNLSEARATPLKTVSASTEKELWATFGVRRFIERYTD